MENKPTAWFFAEWISIIGTFMVCFVFLFYQNQAQTNRSDALNLIQSQRIDKHYEMFCDLQKQLKDEMIKRTDEFLIMKKDQYEFMKDH